MLSHYFLFGNKCCPHCFGIMRTSFLIVGNRFPVPTCCVETRNDVECILSKLLEIYTLDIVNLLSINMA